jgi:hypothetical protein
LHDGASTLLLCNYNSYYNIDEALPFTFSLRKYAVILKETLRTRQKVGGAWWGEAADYVRLTALWQMTGVPA